MILNEARKQGWIVVNRAADVAKLRDDRPEMERPILSVEEKRRLLVGCYEVSPMLGCMVDLMLKTGMRIGEVCGLKWNDIDFFRKCILIRRTFSHGKIGAVKNRKRGQNVIPMSEGCVALLQNHRALTQLRSEYVFCNQVGKPIDYKNLFKREWKRALLRAGLTRLLETRGMGFHTLRHTMISTLIQRGANPKEIQELARHSDIRLTMDTYGHLFPNRLKTTIQLVDGEDDDKILTPFYPREGSEKTKAFVEQLTTRNKGQNISGRVDSNHRPPAPKAGALPGCATPRLSQ